MTWYYLNKTIYSGASPLVRTTVDLTVDSLLNPTGLPAAKKLVVLSYESSAGGIGNQCFQPTDDPTSWLFTDTTYPAGMTTSYQSSSAGMVTGHLVITDALGRVDWISTTSLTGVLKLVGYCDIDILSTVLSPAGSTAWQTLDVSAICPSRAFLIMSILAGAAAGTRYYATRPTETPATTKDYTNGFAGTHKTSQPPNGNKQAIGAYVNPAGQIDYTQSLATLVRTVTAIGKIDLTAPNAGNELVYDAKPPDGNGTIDLDMTLSTALNPTGISGRCFVAVKLETGSPTGFGTSMYAFDPVQNLLGKPCGSLGHIFYAPDTSNLGHVEVLQTDASGHVLWRRGTGGVDYTPLKITILGYVSGLTPVTIDSESPTGITTNPATNVSFHAYDLDGQIIAASMDLTLTYPDGAVRPVRSGGAWAPGYNGTVVSDGATGYTLTLTSHAPFPVGRYTAKADAVSIDAGTGTKTWYFYVSRSGSLVDLNSPIIFVPSTSRYRRASDNAFVTSVDGMIRGVGGIGEMFVGSNGLVSAEFPSIIKPRGWAMTGGDRITLPHNDLLSFTDSHGDHPFTAVLLARVSSFGDYSMLAKAASLANGEYVVFCTSTGEIGLALVDTALGGYIGRKSPADTFLTGIFQVLIFTYSGSGLGTGIKAYRDAVRVDSANYTSGSYAQMVAGVDPLVFGGGCAAAFSAFEGFQAYMALFDWEFSQATVDVVTARLLSLYATSPRR